MQYTCIQTFHASLLMCKILRFMFKFFEIYPFILPTTYIHHLTLYHEVIFNTSPPSYNYLKAKSLSILFITTCPASKMLHKKFLINIYWMNESMNE